MANARCLTSIEIPMLTSGEEVTPPRYWPKSDKAVAREHHDLDTANYQREPQRPTADDRRAIDNYRAKTYTGATRRITRTHQAPRSACNGQRAE